MFGVQSIELQRPPYDYEIQNEVAKQFTHHKEMKQISPVDYGKDIDDVYT